jgi:hypothetical protein
MSDEAVPEVATETPAAPLTPEARWAAMEAKLEAPATEEAPAAAGQPTEAQVQKAVDAAPADSKEREQLLALAKKLGYELEDTKVTTVERADFRKWKDAQKAKLSALEQEIAKKREEAEALHGSKLTEAEKAAQEKLEKAETEVEFAQNLVKAAEEGDYEAIAQLLGHKDWNDLQQGVISKFADPNYKELQELKRWRKEQEEQRSKTEKEKAEAEAKAKREEEERIKEHQRQQEIQARQQQMAAYHKQLSEQMAASEDPLTRVMSQDPQYIAAIVRIQQENWDHETESTVTPEQAAKLAAKGAGTTLMGELEGLYKRLGEVFGGAQAAPAAVKTAEKTPEKPAAAEPEKAAKAPRSAPVPTKGTRAPSAPGRFKTDAEWRAYRDQKMAEAFAEEVLAAKQGRG